MRVDKRKRTKYGLKNEMNTRMKKGRDKRREREGGGERRGRKRREKREIIMQGSNEREREMNGSVI